ncbi:hypothetical protein FGO68_gene2731 [Halteria grandinella]|uniref:GST C-terminal domain-containing protein n=1 Tax=Halteria grandinella TaxID=5974 RepID=A0A8J8P387_HALGN|nr:hypothetical protein FGO68_gene2731 [Halteria grandinella]
MPPIEMDPALYKAELSQAQAKLDQSLDFLDRKLFIQPRIVGKQTTIADISAFADISQMEFLLGFPDIFWGDDRLSLQRWYKDMQQKEESVKYTFGKVEKLIKGSHVKQREALKSME